MPCVFFLLVNRKATTYRHIFSELKQMALEHSIIFSPTIIMTDFESGVIPVIISEMNDKCYEVDFTSFFTDLFLGSVSKTFCLSFHYCQAIYHQIINLGMQQDYLN